MKLVYIGGIGRSGSTLAERILGSMPGVCGLGEVVQIWQRIRRDDRCSCGLELSRCGFWRAVGEEAFGGWDRIDLDHMSARQSELESLRMLPRLAASRLAPAPHAAVTEHAGQYLRIYRAAAAVSGSDVVIDSSKSPGLAFCLRWLPDIDLRVVHLVRDARGVAYSFTKRVKQPIKDGADEMPRLSPAMTALHWTVQNFAFELLSLARGGSAARGLSGVSPAERPSAIRMTRIRYEDFIADPPESARTIGVFAGVPVADATLDHLGPDQVSLDVSHSMAGNPIRFGTGAVRLRADDAWRTGLSAGHRRMVTAICGPLLGRYGYQLMPRLRAEHRSVSMPAGR